MVILPAGHACVSGLERTHCLEELRLSRRKDLGQTRHQSQCLLHEDDALHKDSDALRWVLPGSACPDALRQKGTMPAVSWICMALDNEDGLVYLRYTQESLGVLLLFAQPLLL